MTKNNSLYSCPRCGYTTPHKPSMRKHLYCLQKQCPGQEKNINLTDEIKEVILQNRIWRPPIEPTVTQPPVITLNQTINNYNQMLNYVNKMDVVDKITKYVQHRNIPLLGFEDQVEQTYSETIQKLEEGRFNNFLLNEKDIIGIVDNLTQFTDVDQLNVIHDSVSDHIKMFQSGEWVSMFFDAGLDDLMLRVKCCYLDYYEAFLLKQLWNIAGYTRQVLTERLRDYYNFLVCFELDPYVKGICDGDILGDDKKTFDLEDNYYGVYCKIRDNIKHSDVKRLRKQVSNIVRKNNKSSVVELNSKMLDLMGVDEEFKTVVVQKLQDYMDRHKNELGLSS